uniref:TMEM248/TMEM219 domain-containing protein n=1 Tax=Petromyzon marinus TaxID=7757 RepID=S4RLL2_PETMA
PPVVVFALCCAAAGAACLCVGEFVRRVAVRDPDVAAACVQDWNSLLLHLGELDLCVQEQRSDNDTREVTLPPSPPAPARPARALPTAPGPGAEGPSSAPPLSRPVSVRVLVTLTPSAGSAWGRSGAVSHLGISLPSQALRLAGEGPSRPVNVTLSLATTWDSDDCHLHGNCQAASYNACAIVWADSGVLPNT